MGELSRCPEKACKRVEKLSVSRRREAPGVREFWKEMTEDHGDARMA